MKRPQALLAALAMFAAAPVAAPAKEWDARSQDNALRDLVSDARNAVTAFRLSDPGLSSFFSQAYGYAVFPKITKGGLIFGGAGGKGVLFEQGEPRRRVQLSQGSFGLQAGAKVYREILFFQDKAAYDRFASGNFELSGQAQATIASTGVADQTPYDRGVAIFLLDRGGLMAEATVAGQRFKVEPLNGE
jgi:lipid-binding SYLF domain-containing protein